MEPTRIDGNVAFVTGANRGIGLALTEALIERGAEKIYASARNPETVADLRQRHGDVVVPLGLDVTDPALVDAAAEIAGDTRLLVNNAGIGIGGGLAGDGAVDSARREMEVNYFGPLLMLQSFSPILEGNGGGAIVNILSIASLSCIPFMPTYSASKAAAHSLTQAARALLSAQSTSVHGVYPGPVDTDFAKAHQSEKAAPKDVAHAILDALELGEADIFPDGFAEAFGQQFHSSPKASEEQLAAMVTQA